MASTTLVTFLFDCPAVARTVELLGSWDNFSKPYHLKQDRRRGPTVWSGCWTFEDIICDGDLENISGRRNGALKMGGTYWYYYKVDNDEEHHNPSQPSTTVCPLLPGQRLNVLEVPSESRSRSSSESSGVFTRNPNDKYLTPVPPKPLPSPRLGDLCQETYKPPIYTIRTPRSATYPSTDRILHPGYERHARSASTSPNIAASVVFADFRGIKEKLASKRSAPTTRGTRGLQIGAPTLISTTAEDVNLIPLSSLREPSTLISAPTSAPTSVPVPQSSSSLPLPITAKMREFSPLRSNPVDPRTDLDFSTMKNSSTEEVKRPRSHTPPITTPKLQSSPGRARANSADTRRTEQYLFANEPWIASPKAKPGYDMENKQDMLADEKPAPVLRRPSVSLGPPSLDQRPSSSHGSVRSPGLMKFPLDKDKELPPLPRYLVPAPLFACNSPTKPTKPEERPEEVPEEDPEDQLVSGQSSHFSTWSSDSTTFSSPTSDDEAIHSPTFSSLTGSDSDMDSPQRLSVNFARGEQYTLNHNSAIDDDEHPDDETSQITFSTSPPQLGELRISAFSPNFMNMHIQQTGSISRRQASCFGLGFQGYSLPEDETMSQATITKASLTAEPRISTERVSSANHLEKLMNEFGYLGESVV